MPWVDLNDVNMHLPEDRFWIDEADLEVQEIHAIRTVKGYLLGKYTAVDFAGWDTPDNTPGLIRAIVGLLIASKTYATRLSEEGEDSNFAQNLYNQAMEFLRGLRDGSMSLEEVPDEAVSIIKGFPDDTVEPFFTMEQVL
jgi:hypothetical protein